MNNEKHNQWVQEQRAREAVYDAYRYDDTQRREVLNFIDAANKVIRGEETFDSLTRLAPVGWTMPNRNGDLDGTMYLFKAPFLSPWTTLQLTDSKNNRGKDVEPVYFEISFSPVMTGIPREQLEQLLKLKVVHGYTTEGGNLTRPGAPLHGGTGNLWSWFDYEPLEQPPCAKFRIKVSFLYVGAPNNDMQSLYAANLLGRIEIRRRYLTPEQLMERRDRAFEGLPQTGERCQKSGIYLPIFEDERLNTAERQTQCIGVNGFFPCAQVYNPPAGNELVHVAWQWLRPDPLEAEIEALFSRRP